MAAKQAQVANWSFGRLKSNTSKESGKRWSRTGPRILDLGATYPLDEPCIEPQLVRPLFSNTQSEGLDFSRTSRISFLGGGHPMEPNQREEPLTAREIVLAWLVAAIITFFIYESFLSETFVDGSIALSAIIFTPFYLVYFGIFLHVIYWIIFGKSRPPADPLADLVPAPRSSRVRLESPAPKQKWWIFERLLPDRVAQEDYGDLLERIEQWEAQGLSRALIRREIAHWMLLLLVNGAREHKEILMRRLLSRRR